MSVKFEKMYSTTMPSNRVVYDMVQNGNLLYVLSFGTTSYIDIIKWYGSDSGDEIIWDNLDITNYPTNTNKFKLVSSFNLGGYGPQKSRWLFINETKTKLYVLGTSLGYSSMARINIATDGTVAITLATISITTHICNPVVVNDKLYTLRYSSSASTQYLDITDLISNTLVSISFPSQPQMVRSDMLYYNNIVYMTCWNNMSVLKFNITSNTFVGSIRVNANPYKIKLEPITNKIYVASYGGMISWIDPITDVVTHAHSTVQTYDNSVTTDGIVTDFALTGNNKLWYCAIDELAVNNPPSTGLYGDFEPVVGDNLGVVTNYTSNAIRSSNSLGVIDMLTNNHHFVPMFTSQVDKDYYITTPGATDFLYDKLLITPETNYQYWNGTTFETRIVSPYLFILANTTLYCCRLINELCTANSVSIYSHCMISSGTFDYIGDKN